MYDVFSTKCEILLENRKKTFSRGRSCIDTVASTYNIIQFITKIKTLPCSTVVENDHTAIMWEFNADAYFQTNTYREAKPHHLLLDPNKQSHQKKFVKVAEKVACIFELDTLVKELELQYIPEKVEFFDESFTYMIRKATAAAEGPLRSTPYSENKLVVYSRRRYWKKYLNFITGSNIDVPTMIQDEADGKVANVIAAIVVAARKELVEIEVVHATILATYYRQNSKNERDEYLLDKASENVDVTIMPSSRKKQYLKSLAKCEQRRRSFSYLSKHVGRGENKALSKVIRYNRKNEIVEIAHDKDEVETMVINHNTNHFKQAHNSILCKDKIYNKLTYRDMQDKILCGELDRKDCSNISV